MRVLLPCDPADAAGIGTVVRGLATGLPVALGSDDELVLVGAGAKALRDGANVRALDTSQSPLNVYGGPLVKARRALREQLMVARAASSCDLVHLPDHRPLLLSSTPFVLTVHDVSFLDHPEWYPRHVVRYKRVMLSLALRRPPAVIATVSRFSRDGLLAHCPAARRAAVRVIHPGVARPQESSPCPAAPAEYAGRYFLTVSTIEPRKNHLGLLEAFRAARRSGLQLRWKVVGRPGYRSSSIVESLAAEEGVDLLGLVSPERLERLYRGALFAATPSFIEGFGLPPLEAMARDVPVICSTGSALDETAADAAIRVNPGDRRGWVDGIVRLASEPELRAQLRSLGRTQAARFTIEGMAANYVRAYREALSG